MAVMAGIPGDSTVWTFEALDRLPDDGRRYELLDGVLLVSPAPSVKHQVASRAVFRLLDAACPPGLSTFYAPLDWRPDPGTSLQPDVLVVREVDLEAANLTGPLVLAVEVLSPSTRGQDLGRKRAKYERAGVGSYWVVDPDGPEMVAWDLVDGRFEVAGEAKGEAQLRLRRPFAVTFTPSALLVPDGQ